MRSKRLFRYGITFALSLFYLTGIFSCRHRQTSENASDVSERKAPSPRKVHYLFLISQGFYSCTYSRKNIGSHYVDLIAETLEGAKKFPGYNGLSVKASYMEVCFTGGIILEGSSEKVFASVNIAGEEQRTDRQEFGFVSGPKAVVQMIADRLGEDGTTVKVVMIGHSHGGWLVMNAASDWRGKAKISHLITIDPVSYINCSEAGAIIEKGLKFMYDISLTGLLFPIADNCQVAPTDLIAVMPKILQNIAGKFYNFYETDFSPVHSSSIEGASPNVKLAFPKSNFAHAAILNDQRVWSSIDTLISREIEELSVAD